MIKLKQIVEGFEDTYKHTHGWKTEEIDHEDEETGSIYKKEILSPVQLIHFKTDEGVPYLWYARQDRHEPTAWEIAFGVNKGMEREKFQLDIGLTRTGHAMKIFSTVIDITNEFIEYDQDNYEIMSLIIKSKGDNRTKFYLNRIVPLIDHFKLRDNYKDGDETTIVMTRYD